MIKKKKISAFLFLSLYCFPIVLFIVFCIMQKIVQHEMAEKLEHQSLKKISISIEELKWEDEGKEAIINGHLFDVSYYTITNNTVILTGIFDVEEQAIKDNIANLTLQTKQKENASIGISIFLMATLSFTASNIKVQCNWFWINKKKISINEFYKLSSYSISLLKPPQSV